MSTTNNIKTEYEFDGRTYSILSRSCRNSAKVTFGDVLAIYCNQLMGNENIAAFILTHIAKRKDGKDPNRDGFLNMLVAENVLQKVKVSGENGYIILQKPTAKDFQLAWNYCNELHDNGRNFEAFKDNDTLLAGAAQKSSRLMSLLVSTLIKSSFDFSSELGKDPEFSLDVLISGLTNIYTEATAKKIINCLAVNGAIELYYYENPDGSIDRMVKFNRMPLYVDDLQNYAKYESIPASCASHVHRLKREKNAVVAEIPFFDTYEELQKFYMNNIVHLIRVNKMPKDY